MAGPASSMLGGALAPPPVFAAPPAAPLQVLGEESEFQALSRMMSAGFTKQSEAVEVFRLQVSTLSANFDKMQVEFVESSKRQDLKFAEMKALQDAVIHKSVVESENNCDVKINIMFQKLDAKIEDIRS